jgi:hypothetical protein
MIEAASEVNALPMVETSCPDHMSEKFRWRNTEKGEVGLEGKVAVPVVIGILR